MEIRPFPRSDESFNRIVMDIATELEPTDPATLERALRVSYPSVLVTAQSSLASLGGTVVWYVFRDGDAPIRSDAELDLRRPGHVETTS